MADKSINHYTFLSLKDSFWSLSNERRADLFRSLAAELTSTGSCVNFYQVSPLKADIDLMIWNALPLENEKDEADFFERVARPLHSRRAYLQPVVNLWGYTKPSQYSRGQSTQEIDPFAGQRQTYLVLYPFVKTIQWYLLGRDTRQGMMNEHIRVGHQYPEIKQLLLYSFGVQDQEFIVVYETENLYRFSELVNELRGSDVREYTERDTPVYTGVWRSPEPLGALFAGNGDR
ncbi:MAG TPA: chlorite dismutase family protein [Anaerolineaceae bacterium]